MYPITDAAALTAALAAGASPLTSFESTHGVIRLAADAPFIFISGIANRLGHFGDEGRAEDVPTELCSFSQRGGRARMDVA
jgi:hypothetical protein